MKPHYALRILVAVGLLAWAGAATAEDRAEPPVAGQQVLATVNGEPITLDDLLRHIDMFHQAVMERKEVKLPDPTAVLERIVDARLILQEARNIGLDEMPDVATKLQDGRMDVIRRTLVEHQLESVATPDSAEVEKTYREAVGEARIESVLFEKAERAAAFETSVKEGADFGSLAAELVERGEALAVEQPADIRIRELQPDVAAVVVGLEPGSPSVPVEVDRGYAVIRLLEARFPEDAEARSQAERRALERRQQIALVEYTQKLRECCAEIDDDLVDSLDYEAEKPGMGALRDDDRIVARIEGGAPITVAELTRRIEKKFFHGIEDAIKNNRVNDQVLAVLDRIVLERAAVVELDRLGLDRTADYRNAMTGLEENLLFQTFVSRVIDPEIKLSEDELKAYYDEHVEEFTEAEKVRLEVLAFGDRPNAEAALAKLHDGADLEWMRRHAAGQLGPDAEDPVLELRGKSLPLPELPRGVRDAVAGASRGDVRFHAASGGPYHVLVVTDTSAPRPLPFDQVREYIATQMFALKRQRKIEDWTGELRKASEIEILVDDAELKGLVGLSAREES